MFSKRAGRASVTSCFCADKVGFVLHSRRTEGDTTEDPGQEAEQAHAGVRQRGIHYTGRWTRKELPPPQMMRCDSTRAVVFF